MQEGGSMLIFGDCLEETVPRHKIIIEETYLRQTLKWKDLLIIDFTRIGYWSYENTDIVYEAWKEGKVFFLPKAQKRYV